MIRPAILLIALSTYACSQPAPRSSAAPPPETLEPGALRIGCARIPAAEIEAAGDARLAIDRRIVARAAELWGERATDEQLDRVMAGLLAQTGLTPEALAEELARRGTSLEAYRNDTRLELDRLLVARRAVGTAEDEAAMRRWLDDARARWQRVARRTTGVRCEEVWPQVAARRITLRGAHAVSESALREGLSAERYRAELEPRLRAAERDLEGAYADHGFVQATATSRLDAGAWVIDLREGPRFRTGRVRLVEGAEGRELPLPDGSLAWSEDGWFSRRAVQRSIEAVKQRLGTTIEPDVHVHDGVVDIDLVVGGPS